MADSFVAISEDGIRFKLNSDGTWELDTTVLTGNEGIRFAPVAAKPAQAPLPKPAAKAAPTIPVASPPGTAEILLAGRYRDNGDGTVTDVITGLQWMRFSLGQEWIGGVCKGEAKKYPWQAALDAAKALNLKGGYAGRQDWRVSKQKKSCSAWCIAPVVSPKSGTIPVPTPVKATMKSQLSFSRPFRIRQVRTFGRVRPAPSVRTTGGTSTSAMAIPMSMDAGSAAILFVWCAAESEREKLAGL